MKVIARGKGQSVYLFGGKVKVTFLGNQGSIAKLGFDCPEEVDIMTEEELLKDYQQMKNSGGSDENAS